MKSWWKLTLVLVALVVSATSMSAQSFPMPGKGTGPVCGAGCGDGNEGKKTYPYNDPITQHVGRYVDSTTTINYQDVGIRTVRARNIRFAPDRNRVYIAMGEAVAGYALDRFFTTTVPGSMTGSSSLPTGGNFSSRPKPLEQVAWPIASLFYAEAKTSGWFAPLIDTQTVLLDFDADDRGYTYASTISFGWGIGKDEGNGSHVTFVAGCRPDPKDPTKLTKDVVECAKYERRADAIFTFKSGSKYYVVIGSGRSSDAYHAIKDVTTPSSPKDVANRTGSANGISSWAKNDDAGHIAIIREGSVLVFTYASFISGGNPVASLSPSAGRTFKDISFDDSGRLWAVEAASTISSNLLWSLTPAGSGYTQQFYDAFGESISPQIVDARAGYVAVGGRTSKGRSVILMKLQGATPVRVEIDDFFRKYYFNTDGAYVDINYASLNAVRLFSQGGKTYLMVSAGSLGDVYEIAAGGGLTATVSSSSFGTKNPNTPSSADPGPYYGDILKFKATSPDPNASYSLKWNFANPESSLNNRTATLGQEIAHQYTGLTTSSQISATKKVRVEVGNDFTIFSELPVTLKVPKPRIGGAGLTQPLAAKPSTTLDVVHGESFTDASDGVVEGHVASWNIDGNITNLRPNASMPSGTLGLHTLTLTAKYGQYDPTTFDLASPYSTSISSVSYHVRPFVATLQAPQSSGSNFVFTGVARKTTDIALLNATQWTVSWSLTSPNSVSALATQTTNEPIGTIPSFTVPKSSVGNGSTVKLEVSVPAAAVPDVQYASYSSSQVLSTPDPAIQITSGCTNANEQCKMAAISQTGASMASWQLSWLVKKGTTTVASGSGTTLTFTPTSAGTHTVTLTETVFAVSANRNLDIQETLCGPMPTLLDVAVYTLCGKNCKANEPIEFRADFYPYKVQECDQFSWEFGDGAKATGITATHTYTTSKTYSVNFIVKRATGQTLTVPLSLNVGVVETPCSAPSGIDFSWSGNKGCKPGVNCKNTESVKFTASRNGGSLATCDNTTWTFDAGSPTSTKSPSQTFGTPGQHTVSLVVFNTAGQSQPVTKTLTIVEDTTVGCNGSAQELNLGIQYLGSESGCANGTTKPCKTGEDIFFFPTVFGYSFQACDRFEWDFGDDSAKSSTKEPSHRYTTQRNSYRVSMRVYNTNNPTGVTITQDVPFSNIPILQPPVLSYKSFPATGSQGTAVTFTVESNMSTTGWAWDFGDGTKDNSHASAVGTSDTISHTYSRSGPFTVTVKGRNAADTSTAPTGQALGTITISDIPEYRFLLPVVAHGGGQNGSVWRTDVQIFNPDPNVSATTPLAMSATFNNGAPVQLSVPTSTFIYEDFMKAFTTGDGQGPVVITARTKFAPQIWTRTYNQAQNGTFGQFIPAIRLDSAGGGSAFGEGKYYLAGLRHDSRNRTNLGFVNPNSVPITAVVTVYDDRQLQVGSFTLDLAPFNLLQLPITDPRAVPALPTERPFSVQIEVPAGQWVLAYASYIDLASNDPVFLQAVRESELGSADYRDQVIPGVGHIGAWRSDVTIFNPDLQSMIVDLAYHDGTGAKVAEASVLVGPRAFVQYKDVIKQGILGDVPDSVGALRVSIPAAIPNTAGIRFPLTYARTYNDNGSGRTYGQGIAAFASSRANVKPGKPALVAGIRNNAAYYTNVGLTNVSAVDAIVTVKILDPVTGVETSIPTLTNKLLKPFESVLATDIDLGGKETASLKIETTGGNVWAFASMVDKGTLDPEYIPATIAQ